MCGECEAIFDAEPPSGRDNPASSNTPIHLPLLRLTTASKVEHCRNCDMVSREIEPRIQAVHERVIKIFHMDGLRVSPDKSWVDDNEKDAWTTKIEVLQAFGREIHVHDLLELQYAKQTRRGGGYGEVWEKEKASEPRRQTDVIASIGSAMSLMRNSNRSKVWDGLLSLKYNGMTTEGAT